MIRNELRCGSFTSSEIVALTKEGRTKGTWGAPALTYIEETNMERRLGRSLTDECNAKPISWGTLLEGHVNSLLGLEYILTSQETKQHPTIKFWSGSKDGSKTDGTIFDIKCPLTLKSFCQLVNPLYDGLSGIEAMNAVRFGYVDKHGLSHAPHKDGEKFYWQLASNAIIDEVNYAELIVYVPYKSELPDVKLLATKSDNPEKYYWLTFAGENDLPYLVDGGFYKNLNIIRFEVPKEDKELLTGKVMKAGELLSPYPKALPAPDGSTPYVMVAEHDEQVNATIVQ